MRRMTLFLMALAMVLSITQCKKEQIEPQNAGNTVSITLEVNDVNKGSRAEVDPPHVNFIEHDTILVASNGKYVGYLVHNGTTFSGDITDPTEGKPLYFYFLGNKIIVSTLTPGTTGECTLNISDQTDYPHLPVISMGVSINRSTGETVNYSSEVSSYEARLHNHCSLMKFNVTTASEAAICITGMNNKVTVDFSKIAETGTGLDESDTDNGFSYDKDEEGIIKMTGRNSEERWVIVLPQAALEGTGEAFSEDNAYFGTRPALSAITTDQYLSSGVSMTVNTPAWNGDLSNLTASSSERYATANNGVTITGTLAANVKVSIADGATVTLDGANINNNSSKNGTLNCAGITCKGNATINLYGGSINNINSSSDGYPGIQAGPSGNTLTIQGTGSLSAQGGSNAAGIGGGNEITCGNISLLGGQISACGGDNAPGIGSGQSGSCGDINISRNVAKINITGGSGASVSIGTNGGGTLSVDDVDDVSYINTDSFVYHPVNLSTLTSYYIAKCGDVLRGTLTNNVTISIDDEVPATVILSGANINYEGIVCVSPNVKAILFGTNSVIADSNPGIQAPASGTLTIDGSGSINVQSNAVGCAGIGGKINVDCGAINIKGGSITSCGGQYGAGIGSGQNASCGNIEIEGGSINATGGEGGSNIGAGEGGNCVTVTLHPINGLFSVSPTKQVRFSRGNLESNGTFAVNQCDRGANFRSNEWTAPSADWYVLSADEWDYLCHRSNKLGFATVNNIHGLIILPDNYSGSITKPYDFDNTTSNKEPWDDNIYSGVTWATMENNGVVFLPAQTEVADFGYYWSSSGIFNFRCRWESHGSGTYIGIGGGGSGTWTTSVAHITDSSQRYAYVRLVRTEQTN